MGESDRVRANGSP